MRTPPLDDVSPKSHPSPERLAAYASGWTLWPVELCVRSHLETCGECQARVAELDRREAGVVDSLPEAPLSPKLLRLVEELAASPPPAAGPAALDDVLLPEALAGADIAPRRWVAPGFWVARLRGPPAQNWRAYVLRAPAGQRLPAHGHAGAELICVLKGAVVDGATYGTGDFIETAQATDHAPQAAAEGPCACLVASQGPLITRGFQRLITSALSI